MCIRDRFGADPKESGDIYVNGEKVDIKNPMDAVKCGIGYLSAVSYTHLDVYKRQEGDSVPVSSGRKSSDGYGGDVYKRQFYCCSVVKNSKFPYNFQWR